MHMDESLSCCGVCCLYDIAEELPHKKLFIKELKEKIIQAKQYDYGVMFVALGEDNHTDWDQTKLVPWFEALDFKPVFEGINPNTRHKIVVLRLDLVKNK